MKRKWREEEKTAYRRDNWTIGDKNSRKYRS